MHKTTKFDAVLFDFDGVLLDSEPVHFACWSDALRPLGVRFDWQTYADRCIGASEKATVEIFAGFHDPPLAPELLWERYPLKKDLFRRRMAQDPPFAPGLRAFFEELAGTLRLGVVSSSARAEIEPLLAAAGIRERLGAVVSGDDVAHHKPAPDPYLLAARLLDVRAPLVVEDSNAGMESARAAGFEALRVPAAARTIELVRAVLFGVNNRG